MKQIHKGDTGLKIIAIIKDKETGVLLNVSGATTKEIKLRSPSGIVKVKTASFVNTGSDGQIQYTTIAGDIDEVGIWTSFPYLEGVGGWGGHTLEDQFEALEIPE